MNSKKGLYTKRSEAESRKQAEQEFEAQLDNERFHIPEDAEEVIDSIQVIPINQDIDIHIYPDRQYHGMIIKFSIALWGTEPNSKRKTPFYEIDSSHGIIHEHVYSGRTRSKGKPIAPIPQNDWNFVNNWYQKAQDMCFDIAETAYTRWVDSFIK